MEDILLLVLQSISGGIAGYITNKYAVNMLFKEYTVFNKFKFGGVIKNRKQQFVEEISALVERDIINGSTLKKNLKSDKVKNELENVLNTFFNDELIKAFEKTELNNIPGFNKSLEDIKKFSSDNYDEVMKPLIGELCNEVNLKDLVSEKQVSYIAENIYNLILESVDNNTYINETLTNIYNEGAQITLSDFLSKEAASKVEKNIEDIISSAINKIISNDEKLVSLLKDVLEKIKAEEIINNLQEGIKNKRIEEVISDEELEALSRKIGATLKNYLNTEEGMTLLSNIIKEFISLIKNIEFSLYDLLDDEVADKLTLLIREKLPVFLPYVVSWIEKNKDEFDVLIEKSIDEGIQDMDAGIRKLVLSLVREHFLDNISAKYEVLQKVTEFIESYKMDGSDAIKVADKIIDYLKHTNIKDIITSLEENNILNQNVINKVCEVIITYLSDNENKLILSVIKNQKGKLISDFVKYDFNNLLDINSKVNVYSLVLKHKEKINNLIESVLSTKIHSEFNAIYNKNVKSIISEDFVVSIKNRSTDSIKTLLTNNEEKVKEYLSSIIKDFISNMEVKNIAENDNVKNKLLSLEDELLEKSKSLSVSAVIKKFGKNKDSISYLNEVTLKYLEDNLDSLLDGRIKKIVYDNLIQLDEDEICDLAQRFMGTELKPLSVFGGILGFAGGLIFALCFRNIGFEGYYYSLAGVIGSIILMGGIGVLTNVIAIAMLFKPYKKNKVLSKIPFLRKFALGYIPAHKGNLANGIGGVIDNDILNGGRIHKLLNSKRNVMNSGLMNVISNDNYKLVNNTLVRNKNLVCNYFYNKILSSLYESDVSSKISKAISENEISVSNNILNKISSGIKEKKNVCKKYLLSFLESKIDSPKTVIDILPKGVVEEVERKAGSLVTEKAKELITEENTKMLFVKYNEVYKGYINREVSDIISEDMMNSLEEKAADKMENFLYSDLRFILNFKLREILSKELSEEKTIGNVFNGAIENAVNKNLNKITKLIVMKLTSVIAENEKNIGNMVKDNINSRLNFLQKMGYAMANGDGIVDRCIYILINKNLPIFIDEKVSEVEDMILDGLTNQVYPMKLSDINFGVNEVNVGEFINGVFNNLEEGRKLNNITKVITKELMNKVKALNIESVLSEVNLDSTEKIFNKFNGEINSSISLLLQNTATLKETALIGLKNMAQGITVKELLSSISKEDLENIAGSTVDVLINSNAVNTGLSNITEEVYEKSFKNKKISFIVNLELLDSDLENVINEAKGNEEIKASIKVAVENIFDKICNDNLMIVDAEFKNDINSRVSEAAIDSLIVHTKDILESFELKSITYDEIENMEPEEIHNLFKSFAGEYFKKLYMYGSMGAIFGINFWLSMVIAVFDYAKGRKDNTVNEN